jgi:hypothetical protein
VREAYAAFVDGKQGADVFLRCLQAGKSRKQGGKVVMVYADWEANPKGINIGNGSDEIWISPAAHDGFYGGSYGNS